MGLSPEPQNERNWAMWREYRSGGIRLKDLGAKHGITSGRVQQIVMRCDRLVRGALRKTMRPPVEPLEDHIRNGLLGVEFTFRADDPWDVHCGYGDWVEVDNSWFQITIGASDE